MKEQVAQKFKFFLGDCTILGTWLIVIFAFFCGLYNNLALFTLCLFVVFFWVHGLYTKQYKKYEIRKELENFVKQGSGEGESAEWVNKLLTDLWKQWFTPGLIDFTLATLTFNTNNSIQEEEVPLIKEINFLEIDFGTTAPVITSIRKLPKTDDFQLPLEADVIYAGEVYLVIEVILKGGIKLKFKVSELVLWGNLRVLISSLPEPCETSPAISNIAFSFQTIPHLKNFKITLYDHFEITKVDYFCELIFRYLGTLILSWFTRPEQIVWDWLAPEEEEWDFWLEDEVPYSLGRYKIDNSKEPVDSTDSTSTSTSTSTSASTSTSTLNSKLKSTTKPSPSLDTTKTIAKEIDPKDEVFTKKNSNEDLDNSFSNEEETKKPKKKKQIFRKNERGSNNKSLKSKKKIFKLPKIFSKKSKKK
ncbi:extended synaptotagmin-1 [Anaeramoeba flamelloides]|uniref:Extended synaptotagmin-1 n=1 Tax=Anaeramoeba flamelloides TaxID=1746091 RepID=A0AAV7Z7Q7_9EUKA|nr:extended synaptotagmin-1 [Anaeramoeba flamelloides]